MESENNWWQHQQPTRRANPEAKIVAVAVQDIKYWQPPSAINEKIGFFFRKFEQVISSGR